MVLVVSGVRVNGTWQQHQPPPGSLAGADISELELSDGWYAIKAALDGPLVHMVQQGGLQVCLHRAGWMTLSLACLGHGPRCLTHKTVNCPLCIVHCALSSAALCCMSTAWRACCLASQPATPSPEPSWQAPQRIAPPYIADSTLKKPDTALNQRDLTSGLPACLCSCRSAASFSYKVQYYARTGRRSPWQDTAPRC
jgi:hypothetical protein